ncbi:MAG: hypothetical protein LC667_02205 [Thioalkalivibrio sp.]|nr:hypothetical protein [Thioalkalivibrio sp.]
MGLVKSVASLLEALIRPLMLALGLWKVKEAGKDEAEKEAQERELQAIDDARAAHESLPDVDDELREYRKRRDG